MCRPVRPRGTRRQHPHSAFSAEERLSPLLVRLQQLAALYRCVNDLSSHYAKAKATGTRRSLLSRVLKLLRLPALGYASTSAKPAPAVRCGARRSGALPASVPDRWPNHLQSDIAPVGRAPDSARRSSPGPDPRSVQGSAVSALALRWLAELRPARVRPKKVDARSKDRTKLLQDCKRPPLE